MSHNTPVSPLPLSHLSRMQQRVLGAAQLRAHGVTAAEARERCGPGGGWQQLLPGVFLLHGDPPNGAERLHAAVLYAARHRSAGVMVTGLAALALHGLSAAPAPDALEHIEVLVPHTRRLRSTGFVRLVRSPVPPPPRLVAGVPVAPLPRAVADALARPARQQGPEAVRALLGEAVHAAPEAVVAELRAAGLLTSPPVAGALAALLGADRGAAEGLLYGTVRTYGLPEPVWNCELRLPGGVRLGAVDAFWPEASVAVELTAPPPPGHGAGHGPKDDTEDDTEDDTLPGAVLRWEHVHWEDDVLWAGSVRRYEYDEYPERLGVTVVRVAPWDLCTVAEQQAAVVRTALMAAGDRSPAAHVRVLPR